jgi:DNA-binding CsgD family transcriptional regulator
VSRARELGDAPSLVYALNARRIAIWGPDNLPERLAVATEAARLAEQIGDRETALDASQWRWHALMEQGDLAAADADRATYARLADELRQPLYQCYVPLLRASGALLAGRFGEVELLLEQARALGERANNQNAGQVHAAYSMLLRREQGRIVEAEAALAGFAHQFPRAKTYRSALMLVACETGRRAEAERELERLAADDCASLSRTHFWLLNVAFLSEVCAQLGDARLAEMLYRLLLPYAGQQVMGASVGPCWGSVQRYLGLLAGAARRWEQVTRHFEAALQVHERLGARPWLARTRADYAAMLLARGAAGDRARAADLAAPAQAVARDLGMAALEQRAAELCASAHHAAPRSYPDGLTAREAEVLQLIATGRTTREIADELVVSVGTVERHISNLYGKIGARGRADATAYALRHDLAPPASPPSPPGTGPG